VCERVYEFCLGERESVCVLDRKAFVVQDLVSSWVERHSMRVVTKMHAVFCRITRSVMRVDLVLEGKGIAERHGRFGTALIPNRSGHSEGSELVPSTRTNPLCYLACVYVCKGGVDKKKHMLYAARYMQGVQAICNRDMNFFPGVAVMRVTVRQGMSCQSQGTGPRIARVHVRDVSTS